MGIVAKARAGGRRRDARRDPPAPPRARGRPPRPHPVRRDREHARAEEGHVHEFPRDVVLPGGAGTLDEFFEVVTWAQLGLHARPIVLLDVEGYWQPLLALIDHVIAEGFAEPGLRRLFQVAANPTGRRPDRNGLSPS
jgi:hypothetical protein